MVFSNLNFSHAYCNYGLFMASGGRALVTFFQNTHYAQHMIIRILYFQAVGNAAFTQHRTKSLEAKVDSLQKRLAKAEEDVAAATATTAASAATSSSSSSQICQNASSQFTTISSLLLLAVVYMLIFYRY